MNADPFEGSLTAPAKINLALHVVGRRDDGYHLLESLAVFAQDVADHLAIGPAKRDRLVVDGPFAAGVPTDQRNIVLKALTLARSEAARLDIEIPPLHIQLTKSLPHGAGIGGGSADAAALLRKLGTVSQSLGDKLHGRAAELGADVPMCLLGRPLLARGIGDQLEKIAVDFLPSMVLVNPGRPVSTPAVFKALVKRDNPSLPPMPPEGFSKDSDLLAWLEETRNDLEKTASAIEPAIGRALAELADTGAAFVRMSGSGSTVFGFFDTRESAKAVAAEMARSRPNWWVAIA